MLEDVKACNFLSNEMGELDKLMFIGVLLCSFSFRDEMKKAFATLQRANAGICSHQKNAA